MIDAKKLGRLRLVEKDDKTNKIEVRDHNAKARLDTLTPIITAIGLDITKGLAFPNKKNIIIEGVSDYFYIQGMLDYLKRKEKYSFPDDLVFIPCVGNTNVGNVASLLHGYGFNYKILLDRKGGQKTKNALIRDGISDERIIDVGKQETDSIEELFDEKDQTQFNMKDIDKSKKIISRNFYDRNTDQKNKITLSKKTVNNFRNLLDLIKSDQSAIDYLETQVDEIERKWDEVVEKLSITFSIPPSPETRKKIMNKYMQEIKSAPKSSSKKQIFIHLLNDEGVKIKN